VVVMAIIGILAVLSLPSFNTWLADSRIRTVAEALQNDLRKAQNEAVRRNRQVAFVLTNSNPTVANPSSVANATGRNWVTYALPLLGSIEGVASSAGASSFIQANIQVSNSDTNVTGDAAAVCFNSVGRLVTQSTAIADAGGATCSAPTTTNPIAFNIQNASAERPLRVLLQLGGQIRMCDPNKSLSTHPDGCN
jgi:type IV fimbrial biogenesis protein FimT